VVSVGAVLTLAGFSEAFLILRVQGSGHGIGPVSQLSTILLVRKTGGEAAPADPLASVVLSSDCTEWRHLVLEEHRFQSPYDLDGRKCCNYGRGDRLVARRSDPGLADA
jgi:hypothetical protein